MLESLLLMQHILLPGSAPEKASRCGPASRAACTTRVIPSRRRGIPLIFLNATERCAERNLR